MKKTRNKFVIIVYVCEANRVHVNRNLIYARENFNKKKKHHR